MEKVKIVFMGTPDFSVPVLEALIEKEEYQVVAVVTQPDKEVGRKHKILPPPVKEVAEKAKIKVLQPKKIRTEYQEVLEEKPDIIITCAYGQIIPKVLLDAPKYGCINVHASLLPKLRGGAPIHKAIMYGYQKTGITIMYMDEKMDQGDIITQEETEILKSDNLESLHDRLSLMGRDLLIKTLPSIMAGENKRIKQQETEATYAYNITREEEKIDFSKSCEEVWNQIRALSPTPGAYTILDGKILKVYDSRVEQTNTKKNPGEITNIYKDGIGISCQDGEVVLLDIKWEGKKRMLAKDYLNGINKQELMKKKTE